MASTNDKKLDAKYAGSGSGPLRSQKAIKISARRRNSSSQQDRSESPIDMIQKPKLTNLQTYEILNVTIKEIKIKKKDCLRKPNLVLKHQHSSPSPSPQSHLQSGAIQSEKSKVITTDHLAKDLMRWQYPSNPANLTLTGEQQRKKKPLALSQLDPLLGLRKITNDWLEQQKNISHISGGFNEQAKKNPYRANEMLAQSMKSYNSKYGPSSEHQTLDDRVPASLMCKAAEFVSKNQGLQRLLQQNLANDQQLRFDSFKRMDNNTMQQNVFKTHSVPQTVTHESNKQRTLFQSQRFGSQLPGLHSQENDIDPKYCTQGFANNSGFNRRSGTEVSGIITSSGVNTIRSTIRNMIEEHHQKQLEETKKINQDASIISKRYSKAENKIFQMKPSNQSTLQPEQSQPDKNIPYKKRMQILSVDSNVSNSQLAQDSQIIPQHHLKYRRKSKYVRNHKERQMKTITPKNQKFFRTEQGFYKDNRFSIRNSQSAEVQDIEASIQTRQTLNSAFNSIERRFDELDVEDQEKVMRISFDESRRQRFIQMYDSNKTHLSRKLQNLTCETPPIQSLSNFPDLKIPNPKPINSIVTIKEEDEKQDVIGTELSKIGNRGEGIQPVRNQFLNKQQDQSVLYGSPVQKSKKVTLKPYQTNKDVKIDQNVFKSLNEPIKHSGQIQKRNQIQRKKSSHQLEVKKSVSQCSDPKARGSQKSQVQPNQSNFRVSNVSAMSFGQNKNNRQPPKRINMPQFRNQTVKVQQQNDAYPDNQSHEVKLTIDSDLSSSSGCSSSEDESENIFKKNRREDVSSAARLQLELEAIDTSTKGYIRQLLTDTRRQIDRKNEQSDSVIMQGKSLYGFPTIDTIKKHNETSAQQQLETQIGKRFNGDPFQMGLAMVDQEKNEEIKQNERPKSGYNEHVQFLTGDESKRLGGENAIFNRDPLIKKPGAQYNFNELSDVEMQFMSDNASQFDKMILYMHINKIANCSSVQEIHADHPEYIYYVECGKETDTPLPILSHIYGNTLNLANYTLSPGHTNGLNSAAKYLQTNINRVRFDNCGIDDGEMASLLSAFVQFKDFKSIIYRQNEFDELSLQGICQLFEKRIPYHLQELRISRCRSTPKVTSTLIQAIKQKSMLKQFELAGTTLIQEDVELIGEWAMKSRILEELELQNNNMVPRFMEILMDYMKENKRLVQLNISYNNMIEGFSGNNMARVLETEARVMQQLVTFLRSNKKLIHLDLSATNLGEGAILHILPAIKKARSLQGIHLSGNPGVTDFIKSEARKLLKTNPLEEKTMEKYKLKWLREAVKIKHITLAKSLVQNGATDDKFIDFGSKMILMRYLDHKHEIPGSGQWQLITHKQDSCWLCEREMKGYIFWKADSATKCMKFLDISLEEKQSIFQELQQPQALRVQLPQRPPAYIPPPPEGRRPTIKPQQPPEPVFQTVPVIYGSFTDWQPRPMTSMFDFLQAKELPNDKLDYRNVFEYLQKNNRINSNDKFEEADASQLNLIEQVMVTREKQIFMDWQISLEKSLKYKKPFLVNSDIVQDKESLKQYREIYIAPVFCRSGRQLFVIQPGDSPETLQVYSTVVDFRQEDIPPKAPTISKNREIRTFKKQASVFQKWASDNEKVRDKCLFEHDFLHWKLEKFVKNHEYRAYIEKLYYDNFYFLKNRFIELASESSWPQVSQFGMTYFCQRYGLVDNVHLKMSDIDRMFIAARHDEGFWGKQKNILRYMFFEAITRIAIKRFFNDGKGECATPALAIEKIFEILREKNRFDNWEDWRQNHLYQLPVQDILQANLQELRILYRSCLKPNRKLIDLNDIQLMMAQTSSGLGVQQVQYCFGMSKMTTCFERDKKNIENLSNLEFVEFLEFIGRIAHAKFQGSELEEQLDLGQKIEYILDDILPLVNQNRNDVPFEQESSSEDLSDEY